MRFAPGVIPDRERSVEDVQYCQLVRRFPPSALIPELCVVSTEIGQTDWSASVDGFMVTPWALADIVRVSLAHGNEHRSERPTRRDVLECVDAYNNLTDPDLERDDPDSFERFFLRTAAQQLDFQLTPLHEVARVTAMCEKARPTREPEVMTPGWDVELFGCSLREYVAIGQLILASHAPNHGRFSTSFFGVPGLRGAIGDVPLDQVEEIYRRNFVTDVVNFRLAVRPNDRPAPYRRFTYNPLLAAPLVSGLGEWDYFPVASLMVRKLSTLGLYHQGVQRWGDPFARDLGDLFEQYVGLNLNLCHGAEVLPEIRYDKGRKRSVDWIVVTPSAVVLVEAKSVRPTEPVRTGSPAAGNELHRMLQKAGEQIDRTSAQIEQGVREFAHIPSDLPRVGVIATMGDFHVANAAPIRSYSGLSAHTPRVIASISELEHAVVRAADLGDVLLRVLEGDAASGHSLKRALAGTDSTRNPIIDDAWKSGLLPHFTTQALAARAHGGQARQVD